MYLFFGNLSVTFINNINVILKKKPNFLMFTEKVTYFFYWYAQNTCLATQQP